MYKRMVYIYETDEQINQFVIGYMINPSRHINKVFIEKNWRMLKSAFTEKKMETIRYVMKRRVHVLLY